jgi:hypothetical protein
MACLDIEHFTELLCGPNFVTYNIILIQHKFTVILVWNIANFSDKSYTNIHK